MISDAQFCKLFDKIAKLRDKLAVKLARVKHLKEELEYLDYDVRDLKEKIKEVQKRMQE